MASKRIDDHTLQVLEFQRVLELLAHHASCPLGRDAARALYPSTDESWIRARIAETTEVKTLLDQDVRLPLAGIRDIRHLIKHLGEKQTLFDPPQLLDIADTLAACTRLRHFLSDQPVETFPQLHSLGEKLEDFTSLTEAIDRCIDADRTVKDSASEKLGKLRRHIQSLECDIRIQFDRIVSRPELRSAIENPNFMMRHGRPVLAVRENYRSRVPGTVLDRSHSGMTLYIEPDSLIDLSNALEDTRFQEQKEIDRILWELTHLIVQHREVILRAVRLLGLIDLAYAKAHFSQAYQLAPPALSATGHLHLRDARHPLLLMLLTERPEGKLRAAYEEVIPVSPRLGDDFDLLLVTGPNTGGKTVLLKTLGLCVLMAQSGMHIPAHTDSQIPVYQRVFADIGDEQSLEQSLSTFSAHIAHIARILQKTREHSLVLLDELGAGTDPDEGAALGTVILNRLITQGGHILATTHLGRLKTFAYSHPQAENASVSFNPETLQPTYALTIGTPGSSNALSIAQRLGVPKALLQTARTMLETRGQEAEQLITQLQQSRQQAEQRREQAQTLLDQAHDTRNQAQGQLQQAHEEGQRLRRLAEIELEASMREVRVIAQQLGRAAQNAPQAWRDEALDLMQKLESLAQDTPLAERQRRYIEQLKKGDLVYVIPFRRRGIVDRIRRKKGTITVLLDSKQIELPSDQICRPENQ